jgi:hypothetical protein
MEGRLGGIPLTDVVTGKVAITHNMVREDNALL